MQVTILGTGAYGIALALMFHENKTNQITMWTKFEEEAKDLNKYRENKKVLPGVKIPKEIKFSNDIDESITTADIIVFAVPAHALDDVAFLMRGMVKPTQHLLVASKGIESGTCLFPTDIIAKHIKSRNIGVISGPSFAIDMAAGVPIGLTIATKSIATKRATIQSLQNRYLRLIPTTDVIGTQICGSIKNVIAIAAGMLAGMKLPESTQAMFITESLHCIKNLIHALGGNKRTILSYAGFGDLLLTCTSVKSRNYRYGYMIGAGEDKKKIKEYSDNTTVEGLYTLTSIMQLLNHKKVSIPMIDLIYNIIVYGEDPKTLTDFLTKED